MIAFLDLGRRAASEREDLEAAFAAVLDRGRFVGGPALERFENEFAAYCGVAHAVGLNSGTDALALALRASGVGPGDEVITAANTCVATITGIVGSGATPVLADVHPETWTLDPASVERVVTPHTRAVMPVHLYGQLAEVDYGLPVVEDAAQAVGAEPRRGPLAAYSFYPTKNLGALGDGGAVVTEDAELAGRLRMLRSHGEQAQMRGVGVLAGVNSRLDEVQAEVLSRRLARLDDGNARRREVAAYYLENLRGVTLPIEAEGTRHCWHLFVVLAGDREGLRAKLRAHGVETLVHYPVPIHRQPAWTHLGGSFPVAERLCDQVVSLPLYPELTDAEVEQVVGAVNA